MGDGRPSQSVQTGSHAKLVVVIDDDPLVLEAMGGLLRKWGYDVLTAATVDAALAGLAERRRLPDLIVCDHHLSGGRTGFEAIERLRVGPTPALLIASDVAAAESESALSGTHGIHIVGKPADANILHSMVTQVLREPGGRAMSKRVVKRKRKSISKRK